MFTSLLKSSLISCFLPKEIPLLPFSLSRSDKLARVAGGIVRVRAVEFVCG